MSKSSVLHIGIQLISRSFSNPILDDAVQKYESKPADLKEKEKEIVDEQDTLLDHLVKTTTGMCHDPSYTSNY